MSQFIEMFGNPLFNTKKWKWYSNINNVVTIVLGSTPNTKEPKYWDGDIKWVTPAEMDDETFMINDTLRHITEFGVKSANLTKLPIGSVLFSTRAPIGKVGIAAAEMYCNQGFKSFICSNQVDSIFLYYTLKLNKEYLCSLGTGTTFKELSKKTVEGLKLGVPPIDLQKQFAIIYKQADKSKFGDFKSQFIEMFGNPVNNSKSWPTKAIMEVAPEQPSKKQMPGKVWLLNLDMIESNTGKVIEKVYETSDNTLSVQPFDEDNVLFSKLRPYLNKVVVPDEYGLATTELVPLRPNQEVLNKVFLSYLLRSQQFVTFANKISGGTKMPRMPLAELRNFKCILPPMSEQLKFVSIAKQADKSKSYVWTALKNLESMLGYYIRQVA